MGARQEEVLGLHHAAVNSEQLWAIQLIYHRLLCGFAHRLCVFLRMEHKSRTQMLA